MDSRIQTHVIFFYHSLLQIILISKDTDQDIHFQKNVHSHKISRIWIFSFYYKKIIAFIKAREECNLYSIYDFVRKFTFLCFSFLALGFVSAHCAPKATNDKTIHLKFFSKLQIYRHHGTNKFTTKIGSSLPNTIWSLLVVNFPL